MLILYLLYICDNYILVPFKGLIPPAYYVHIDILQFMYLRHYSIRTPLICIVGDMLLITILKYVYAVRTDMFSEKSDKLINLLIRCIIVECRSESLIYNKLVFYDCLHTCCILLLLLELFRTTHAHSQKRTILVLCLHSVPVRA